MGLTLVLAFRDVTVDPLIYIMIRETSLTLCIIPSGHIVDDLYPYPYSFIHIPSPPSLSLLLSAWLDTTLPDHHTCPSSPSGPF